MRLTYLTIAALLAGCSAVAEPSADDLRQALVRRGGGEAVIAKLAKLKCTPAGTDRFVCDYELPDCPPYKPRCGRTRVHSGRFGDVAGGWQYLGGASVDPKLAVRTE